VKTLGYCVVDCACVVFALSDNFNLVFIQNEVVLMSKKQRGLLSVLSNRNVKSQGQRRKTQTRFRLEALEERQLLSATLHVDTDIVGGLNDGSTWTDAYADVQTAFTQATALNNDANPGNDVDSIWIADGVYTPATLTGFAPPSDVSILGGFAGGEISAAARTLDGTVVTTLSGDMNGDDNGTPGTLTDNAAQVILASGVTGTTIDAVTITAGNDPSGYGGGLRVDGGSDITLSNSTVEGNAAKHGGGAYVTQASNLELLGTTITDNTASYGAGLSAYYGATLTAENSTISGNEASVAGGGLTLRYSGVSADLNHVTIADNVAPTGAGIETGASLVTLTNTLVADNLTPVDAPSDISGSVVASSSNNLVGDSTGVSGLTVVNGNILDVNANLVDLADNGGPTLTHALLSISSAVDNAAAGLALDQRGVARPFGSAHDIGAFEGAVSATLPTELLVTNLTDIADGNYLDLSLREAILLIDQVADTTIEFAPGLTGTITLTGGQLDLSDDIAIEGPGQSLLTISGGGTSRVFDVVGSSLTLSDLTVANGYSTGRGGNISVRSGELHLDGVMVTGGQSETHGGGIYVSNSGSLLMMTDSVVQSNTSLAGSGLGGGITLFPGSTGVIEDSVIRYNSGAYGSAVSAYNGAGLTISNTTIAGNSATQRAAVRVWNTDAEIRNATITQNFAFLSAGISVADGGVYSDVLLVNSIVADNIDDLRNCIYGTLNAASSNNLIGDGTTAGLVNGENGNIVGTADAPLDPQIQGVFSLTGIDHYVPFASSRAVDAGLNAGVPGATDQLGNNRIANGTADIGAVEIQDSGRGELYVDLNASGADDGSSWTDAYPSLQDALAQALELNTDINVYNDIFAIKIADGTYTPATGPVFGPFASRARLANFSLVPGVNLIGGFGGETILSGDNAGDDPASELDNSHSVVVGINVSRAGLENITISGGVAQGGLFETVDEVEIDLSSGGGVNLVDSSLWLTNVLLTGNSADNLGGALAQEGGETFLSETAFEDNSASTGGGGMSVLNGLSMIDQSSFTGNLAYYGGGLSVGSGATVTMTSSWGSDNDAAFGGGIFIDEGFDGGFLTIPPGTLNLGNSIVSGNLVPANENIFGPWNDLGQNFVGELNSPQDTVFVDDDWAGKSQGEWFQADLLNGAAVDPGVDGLLEWYKFGVNAFDTIQGGVDGTPGGAASIVNVLDGAYAETVTIAKDADVDGLTEAGVQLTGGFILEAGADGVTLQDMTIAGNTTLISYDNPGSTPIVGLTLQGLTLDGGGTSSHALAENGFAATGSSGLLGGTVLMTDLDVSGFVGELTFQVRPAANADVTLSESDFDSNEGRIHVRGGGSNISVAITNVDVTNQGGPAQPAVEAYDVEILDIDGLNVTSDTAPIGLQAYRIGTLTLDGSSFDMNSNTGSVGVVLYEALGSVTIATTSISNAGQAGILALAAGTIDLDVDVSGMTFTGNGANAITGSAHPGVGFEIAYGDIVTVGEGATTDITGDVTGLTIVQSITPESPLPNDPQGTLSLLSNTQNTDLDLVVVDDSFATAGLQFGQWFDDAGTWRHYGYNALDTIQDGIDSVNVNGTVDVYAGTYDDDLQIVIDKDMEITGAGKGITVLNPAGDTGSSGDARGWLLVDSGVNLDLSGMTLDGDGTLIYQGIRHKGTGTIDDVAFENILYNESGPDYQGTAVAAFNGGTGDLDVTDSTFDNIGRIGVVYSGTSGEFSGNTYTGKGAGDWLDYAVEIGSGSVVDVIGNSITGNRGVSSFDSASSTAILVSTFYGAGTTVDITGANVLTDNNTGVHVGYDASDTSVVTIDGATISNSDMGVVMLGGDVTIDSATISNSVSGGVVMSGGVVTIDGAALTDNYIGVDVRGTGDAYITGNTTITGGDFGVVVDGSSASVTFGIPAPVPAPGPLAPPMPGLDATITGQGYYIVLINGAMDDETRDITNVAFDTGIDLTTLEDRLWHAIDDPGVGQLVYDLGAWPLTNVYAGTLTAADGALDTANEVVWLDMDNDGTVDQAAYYGLTGFETINAAISGVDVGGTVHVAAETFAEGEIVVNKSLTLQGYDEATPAPVPGSPAPTPGPVGMSTIDVSGSDDGVTITASNVTVDNFEIVGDDATGYGVYVEGDGVTPLSNITISDNKIHGMGLGDGDNNVMSFGILVDSVDSVGPVSSTVSDVTVTGNDIYDLGGGFVAPGVTSVGFGIVLQNVAGTNSVTGNTFNDLYGNVAIDAVPITLADAAVNVNQDGADFGNSVIWLIDMPGTNDATITLTGQHAKLAGVDGSAAGFDLSASDAYVPLIQTAVDYALPTGSTVTLTAGTFDETVSIDKSLSLIGAKNLDDPTVATPTRSVGDTTGESVLDGAISITAAVDVTIDGLYIAYDGSTMDTTNAAINLPVAGASITVEDTILVGNNPAVNDAGIHGRTSVPVAMSLSDNVFDGWALGVSVGAGNTQPVSIDSNVFTNNDIGIAGLGGTDGVSITDNAFTDYVDEGIGMDNTGGVPNDLTITGNEFSSTTAGSWALAQSGATPATSSDWTLNSITGVGGGVTNAGTEADVTLNWWGSNNEATIAARQSGLVNFDFWLNDAGQLTTLDNIWTNGMNPAGLQGAFDQIDNTVANGGTLHVTAGTYTDEFTISDKSMTVLIEETVTLQDGSGTILTIDTGVNPDVDTVTIIGDGNLTIDGLGTARGVKLGTDTLTQLEGAHITNGFTTGAEVGAAIYVIGGDLELVNSLLDNNTDGTGGAIALYGGDVHIVNSTITKNTGNLGGGIFIALGDLILDNSIVAGNIAANHFELSGSIVFDGGPDIMFSPSGGASASVSGSKNIIGSSYGSHGFVDGVSGNAVGDFEPVSDGLGGWLSPADIDDLFTDFDGDDFTLAAAAVDAIDGGSSTIWDNISWLDDADVEDDLDGNDREQNGDIDMGAYEFEVI
jgi:hypothetical protein